MARRPLRPGDIVKVNDRIGAICKLDSADEGKSFRIQYRSVDGGDGGGEHSIPAETRRVGRVDALVLKKICKGVG